MMAKRTRNSSDAVVIELSRQEQGDYVVIVYLYAEGLPNDPASTVSHRIAVYKPEQAPSTAEEFSRLTEKASKAARGWYFDGAPGAILDDQVLIVREADRDAQQMREQEEQLFDRQRAASWSNKEQKDLPPTRYEQFWEAVARAQANPQDDDAWSTIDSWRLREVLKDESGESNSRRRGY